MGTRCVRKKDRKTFEERLYLIDWFGIGNGWLVFDAAKKWAERRSVWTDMTDIQLQTIVNTNLPVENNLENGLSVLPENQAMSSNQIPMGADLQLQTVENTTSQVENNLENGSMILPENQATSSNQGTTESDLPVHTIGNTTSQIENSLENDSSILPENQASSSNQRPTASADECETRPIQPESVKMQKYLKHQRIVLQKLETCNNV